MAQMDRNLNLEELNTDTPFGIEALRWQSIGQKAVFWGSLLLGIAVNIVLPMVFHLPRILAAAIFLVLLAIGVGAGCNYAPGMTYGRYAYCCVFGKPQVLTYRSTQDPALIQAPEKQNKQEDGMEEEENREQSRKTLAKLVIFILVVIITVAGTFAYKDIRDSQKIHHRADTEEGYEK